MSRAAPVPGLPIEVDEETVQRLCGAQTFAAADALQRAGHVLGPTYDGEGVAAGVRGTWRRVDRAGLHIRGGRAQPTCTRDGAAFCRHVGALLLEVIRNPAALTPGDAAFEAFEDEFGTLVTVQPGAAPAIDEGEPPLAELTRLLEADTVPRLRELARRRGVGVSGSKKADVVRSLAAGLADPAGIDAALAALGPSERLALDAAYIAAVAAPPSAGSIVRVVQLLGGTATTSDVESLRTAGLVFNVAEYSYGDDEYAVPRTVAARLSPRDDLTLRTSVKDASAGSGGAAKLGIVETLQVIAQATMSDQVGRQTEERPPDLAAYRLPGFSIDPAVAEAVAADPDLATKGNGIRLVPLRLLGDADLQRLADRAGQSVDAIDFAVRLMRSLQIAEATSPLTVRAERLQALLDLPPSARLAAVYRAWLATAGLPELGLLVADGGQLRLRWRPTYATWYQPFQQPLAAAVALVARLIGRMAPDVWYDLGAFVRTVNEVATFAAPTLVQLRSLPPTAQSLVLLAPTKRGGEQPLALRTPEGWTRFLAALVATLLTGPLTWLGCVEVIVRPDRTGALRVRRAAGVLAERGDAVESSARSGQIVVDADLSVLVPAGTVDAAVHGLLARAGDLVAASGEGLRYRLTPAGLQALFDAGTTGPEFVRFLAERAGGALPAAVRSTIDRWWSDYGTVRLYDELAVIELNDDVLLTELLAATSLDASLVHTFSPRLIAVDSAKADDLVAELTSRGYAPRVVEME